MITCAYAGRLGNIMFEIAAATSLAHSINDVCRLKNWEQMDAFKISEYGFIIFDKDDISLPLFSEPGFTYSDISSVRNRKLCGFYQSDKYFNEELVRGIFSFKDKHIEYIEDKFGEILEKNTVSMHLRRGDYVGSEAFPVMSTTYYIDALEIVEKTNSIDHILVFSDDIEYCKTQFKDSRYIFVHEEDYMDLAIMSMCKHNIICNSTFSWWGSYLNKNKNKIVISPRKWFTGSLGHRDVSDIFCDNWTVIEDRG
jgi:hypothetical protein